MLIRSNKLALILLFLVQDKIEKALRGGRLVIMPMYSMYSSPTLGMLSQTSAFGSISQNVSNMRTGGYKAHHTRFTTILASQMGNSRDIGGIKSETFDYIEQQGRLLNTKYGLDLAINGKGLFVLNSEANGSGDTLYTRDGAFQIKADEQIADVNGNLYNSGYLVNKSGHYLQGWEADAAGAISSTGALRSIRIDTEAFSLSGPAAAAATTSASVAMNLPATTVLTGSSETTKGSVLDASGDLLSFDLIWTKASQPQTWTLTVNPQSGTSTSTTTVTFDTEGRLPTGTTTPIELTSAGGTTTTFTLDISDLTSMGDKYYYFGFDRDGRTAGELDSYRFDATGKLIGKFTNGHEGPLYKLPLATFTNADKLDRLTGNIFQVSVDSGAATLREIKPASAETSGPRWEFATFLPEHQELSNVDLQIQFTEMIMAQQAYNSSATVFKSVDEMTKLAASLKT